MSKDTTTEGRFRAGRQKQPKNKGIVEEALMDEYPVEPDTGRKPGKTPDKLDANPVDIRYFDHGDVQEDYNPDSMNPITGIVANIDGAAQEGRMYTEPIRIVFNDKTEKILDNRDVDFMPGQLSIINIDGINFFNRDKIQISGYRSRPKRGPNHVVNYSEEDKARTHTEIHAFADTGIPFMLKYPAGFLNVNEMLCIIWHGYTFWHDAWIDHAGLNRKLGIRKKEASVYASL